MISRTWLVTHTYKTSLSTLKSGMSYCDRCDRHFVSDGALKMHKQNSSNHYYCHTCRKMFETDDGRKRHYQQKHYYCLPCDRHFSSHNSLRQHLNSAIHLW